MSSDSRAASQGTKGDGSGNDGRSGLKQSSLLGFLGTLPGLISAVAALITAIGGAFLGGTQRHPL